MAKTALIITLAAVAAGAAGVTGSTLFLTGTVGDYFKDYTITFEENGGSEVNDVTQLVDSKIVIPNDPTKTNCKFEGWYSDKDLKEKYTFDKMPGKNITLYAKWSLNEVTITFNSNGGSEVSPITKIPGDDVTAPVAPTKEKYKFVGWFEDEGLTKAYTFAKMPAKNITLYAKWELNTSTIKFVSNGGSEVSSIEGVIGEKVSEPITPTKEGHSFGGWYKDAELTTTYSFTKMPETDLTLYAKWDKLNYTISFNSNGGSEVTSIRKLYGDEVQKPTDPIKEGHTFDGWYIDEALKEPFTFQTMPAKDVKLFAKWKLNKYTITFNSNGGTEVKTIEQLYGTDVTKPTDPTKEGHAFIGWFADETLETPYTFSKISANNVTVYAKWEVCTYNVVYHTNGGGTIPITSAKFGTALLKPSDPYIKGQAFAGWFTDVELSIPFVFDEKTTMPGHNLDLYAKYVVDNLTYSLSKDGDYYVCNGIQKGKEEDTKNVIISSKYNDDVNGIKDVKVVGATAFKSKQIDSVVLADTIEFIEKESFSSSSIKSFTSGSNLKYILEKSFYYCEELTDVKLNKGLKYIGSNAYYGSSKLVDLNIPNTVEIIHSGNFEGTGIKKVIIPASVTKVYSYLFARTTIDVYIETASQMKYWNPIWINNINNDSHVYIGKENWENKDTYTLKFDFVDGSGENFDVTGTYGEIKPFPVPTKPGLEIYGWFDGTNILPKNVIVAKNATLEARYGYEINYSVPVDRRFGYVYGSYILEDEEFLLPTAKPTIEEGTFVGWALDRDGKQMITSFEGMPKQSYNLYAIFAFNKYSITLHTIGAEHDGEVITKEYKENFELPILTKPGEVFLGWYTEADYQNEFTSGTMSNQNLDIYAKWRPAQQVEVTILDASGQLNQHKVTVTEGTYVDLPVPAETEWFDELEEDMHEKLKSFKGYDLPKNADGKYLIRTETYIYMVWSAY